MQKDSFYNAKGLVLEGKRTPFEKGARENQKNIEVIAKKQAKKLVE